jgi:hypothetical protein
MDQVGLVRVAQGGRDPGEAARLSPLAPERGQQSLEPVDPLQRLRPVSDRVAKPPLELAFADSKRIGDARNPCLGMLEER